MGRFIFFPSPWTNVHLCPALHLLFWFALRGAAPRPPPPLFFPFRPSATMAKRELSTTLKNLKVPSPSSPLPLFLFGFFPAQFWCLLCWFRLQAWKCRMLFPHELLWIGFCCFKVGIVGKLWSFQIVRWFGCLFWCGCLSKGSILMF